MTYEYFCGQCNASTDIMKPVAQYDKIESCEKCGTIMVRAFAPQKIHLFGTAVEDKYFNHGLGQVVSGKADVKRICKEKNLIEVGNERPEKHLKVERQEY